MPSTKIKSISHAAKLQDTESFDLTDKVKYEDFIRENIPEEIIFPEELNRFLRDQIRELTSENGCLRRSVNELEEKLSTLVVNKSPASEPGENPLPLHQFGNKSGEIAASKIVDLSKKCREQTAEIEVLKSKCKKLESKLSEKRIKSEEIKPCKNSGDAIDSRPLTIEDELKIRDDEVKILHEKINQINSKLYESKNLSTSLRQELNKAQKLLRKEVGEGVKTSSNSAGWRGRAEIIQQLQNKLIEYEGNSSRGSSATLLEKRNLAGLRNLEKERRENAENMSRELRRISVDLEASNRKRDAAKARVKVLETDLTSVKHSVALLNEKRSHDEQLIEALNRQAKAMEDKFRDREKEIIGVKNRAENERVKLSSELMRLQAGNESLRKTLEERETEIDSLRSRYAARGEESKGNESSPLSRGCKIEVCSNEYVTIGIAAEAERERLLELVIVLNRRLGEERFATDKIGETLRGERIKLARLETKLQRLEIERVGMSRVNTGYKTRSSKSAILYEGDGEKEETRFRLELLEEECLALKTRLATVQRDKTSDLAMYKQMLDQARKTFQDAYRGKPTSSSYSTVTI